MIEKKVWQDEKEEKELSLEVPVNLQNDRLYGEEKKSDIPDENLLIMTSKISKKSHDICCNFMEWCNQTIFSN